MIRARLLAAVVAVAVGAACSSDDGASAGSAGSSVSPTTAAIPVSTEVPQPASREPERWPFSSDSPWNLPVGSGVDHLLASQPLTELLTRPDIDVWINAARFSHPVFPAELDDPLVAVRYDATVGQGLGGVVEIHLPTEAAPAEGEDGHLHVIDPARRWVDEFFVFAQDGSGARAAYWVRNDLRADGVSNGGTRAYGGSAIGGLVREWEFERGRIDHALALALTNEQLGRGPVWPATLEDANADRTYSGAIPMGTLVSIPLDVDVESLDLSDDGRMIARTLQRYGAYVVDRSGSVTFYAEPVLEDRLGALRADLPEIRRHLRIVSNGSSLEPGGPGTRVAPLAPPLPLP